MIVFDESSDSDLDPPPPKKVKSFKPPEAESASISEPHLSKENTAKDYEKPFEVDSKPDPDTSNDDFMSMKIESDDEIKNEKKASKISHKTSLSQSILNENSVGFKMMQMMGFKSNSGLGVENNPNAIKEPIAITKRKSRGGIGSNKSQVVVLKPIDSESTKRYHVTSKEAFEERFKCSTIQKLQKFCYEETKEMTAGEDDKSLASNPLWRDYIIRIYGDDYPDLIPDHDQQSPSTDAKLQALLEYSRSKFFYCTYCGIKYADKDELLRQCPGVFHELHPC